MSGCPVSNKSAARVEDPVLLGDLSCLVGGFARRLDHVDDLAILDHRVIDSSGLTRQRILQDLSILVAQVLLALNRRIGMLLLQFVFGCLLSLRPIAVVFLDLLLLGICGEFFRRFLDMPAIAVLGTLLCG